MGRGAFGFILEFAVALPDHSAVLVIGVPHLGAVHAAAVAAEDLPGEGTAAVVASALPLPPGDLRLHRFPFLGTDDCRVAVLHIVLGHLAFVDLHGLGEKIHGVPFLKQGRTLVLFVPQNALNRGALPVLLAAGGGDLLLGQVSGNGGGILPGHEHPVDWEQKWTESTQPNRRARLKNELDMKRLRSHSTQNGTIIRGTQSHLINSLPDLT